MKLLLAACVSMMMSAPPPDPSGAAPPAPVAPTATQPTPAEDAARAARVVLDEIAAVYRNAKAITDTVVIRQEVAGRSWEMTYALALGEGADAQVSHEGVTLTALGESLLITSESAPDKYCQIPLDQNIALTMLQLPGWGPLPLPDLALRYGSATDDPTLVFNLGMPLRQRILSHGLVERDGRSTLEIRFSGPYGATVAQVDQKTKLIQSVRATFVPVGGKPNAAKIYTVQMNTKVEDRLPAPIALDTTSRRRVADISKLVPLAEGDVIADASLRTIDGRTINLKDHRGSVVVLGFWSSWCGPCRESLTVLDKFAAWARASGKPIIVYAVNAHEMLDRSKDNPEARQAHVKEFWSTTGLSIPVVLDASDELYGKFGFNDIPTAVVIIAPDGKIVTTHSSMPSDSGDPADVPEQLKKEALAALGSPG